MSQSPKVSKFTFSQEIPIEVSLAGLDCLAKLIIVGFKVVSQLIEAETTREKIRRSEPQDELAVRRPDKPKKQS